MTYTHIYYVIIIRSEDAYLLTYIFIYLILKYYLLIIFKIKNYDNEG